jgi:hypothetical protein
MVTEGLWANERSRADMSNRLHIENPAYIGKVVAEILERGNSAEVKAVKDGIIVLEVKKTIKGKI